MKRILLCAIIVISLSCAALAQDNEIRRIRIENSSGGLVQVSLEKGRNYRTVGRVTTPAVVSVVGFGAATYTPASAVAAIAVHGLRIKTGQEIDSIGKGALPLIFSVVPMEFRTIPNRFGGHLPRSSGIETDIHSGTSIFRNLSPYVGSQVYKEVNGNLKLLPEGYMPRPNDVFVITVQRPDAPASIVFDNIKGGSVVAVYRNGGSKTLAQVVRPVSAVGRYDGTTFNGSGSINTNHGGVITVSTAPKQPFNTVEGGSVETRGGFMIQPLFHINDQRENKPQVMAIAADDSAKALLEGTEPLFRGNICLAFHPKRPENSCIVQISVDHGDWEPMPEIVGRVDDAFTAKYLSKKLGRSLKTGVTAVRLLIPEYDLDSAQKNLDSDVSDYNARLIAAKAKTVSGSVPLKAKHPHPGAICTFYVNGIRVYTSNISPASYTLDTTKLPNGLHRIEIETSNTVEVHRLMVWNISGEK